MHSMHRWRRVGLGPGPVAALPQAAVETTGEASPSAARAPRAVQVSTSAACPLPRPCPTRLASLPTRHAGASALSRAVAAAQESKHALRRTAYEMATQWHLPWRTRGRWAHRLRQAAQAWVGGDLAAARRLQQVGFSHILLGVQDHDTTPDRRNFAAFVLLWAQSVQQAISHPTQIEGAETADALDAVGAYLIFVRGRYGKIFAPDVTQRLTQAADRLVEHARAMRGCLPTK